MTNHFHFTVEKTRARARAGWFETPHGRVLTPMFMPVGTSGSIKSLDSLDMENLEAEIILANTYHLYLKPGMEILTSQGGIHEFMKWSKPILTDSGGFQIFSLKPKITDQGAKFRSYLDGSSHFFTPEKAMEIQRQIGADIIMAFDECMRDGLNRTKAEISVERTTAWARACTDYWQSKEKLSHYGRYQALFGIIQGGLYQELRLKSLKEITSLGFDGIALGGQTIGMNMDGTKQVMDWLEPFLPQDKPRYAMGLGREPQDLIDAVEAGFDMFDCVAPTRLARSGEIFFGDLDFKKGNLKFVSPFKHSRYKIKDEALAHDNQVLQPGCGCYTCRAGYTRSYLRHLYKARELTYYRLASIHNLWIMLNTVKQIRSSIIL